MALRVLGEVGWETATADLDWCTTEKDLYKVDIVFNGEITLRTEAKVGFTVLGTLVPFDNNFDVEVEKGLARATRASHAKRDMLGCIRIPLPKRLQVFRATVEASMRQCAGPGILRGEQPQRIRGAQSRLIRECYVPKGTQVSLWATSSTGPTGSPSPA